MINRRPNSHRVAATWVYVLIALALMAAAAIAVVALRRGVEPPPPAPPDPARVTQELEVLQQAFSDAIQNKRGLDNVVARLAAFVDTHPDRADARQTYALTLIQAGETEPAYEQLRRALELDAGDAELHRLAGSLAMQLRRVEDALRHFSQAVGLEPANPRHRLMLANALGEAGRFDEARKALLEALKMDSSLHAAHLAMADLYARQNKINLALDQVARALDAVGDDEAARELYLRRQAALLRRDNRPEEALAVLRRLPAARLVSPEISDDLAQTYTLLGRPADAARHYEQVLIVNPTADWAAERAAHYRLRAGQPDEARQNVERLRRINPRAPQIGELEREIAG